MIKVMDGTRDTIRNSDRSERRDKRWQVANGAPTTLTVQVDSREGYPIPFPAFIKLNSLNPKGHGEKVMTVKIKTQVKALPYGDYRLREFPECCVVERKGGLLELRKNLFDLKDSVRQAKSFRKLSACEYPYLLVEAGPSELLRKIPPLVMEPEVVMNRMIMVAAKYGFHMLWVKTTKNNRARGRGRRDLGTALAHIMVGHALSSAYEILPEALDVESEANLLS